MICDQSKGIILQEIVEELINLNHLEWGDYFLSGDPLYKKISDKDKQDIIKKSQQCAKKQLLKWTNNHKSLTLKEAIHSNELTIFYNESPIIMEFMYFGLFDGHSSTIEVSLEAIAKVEKVITENQLWETLERVDLQQLILAHEFYHYLELTENLYTRQSTVELPMFRVLSKKRHVRAASEIAAVHFSQLWLGLNYCPAIFDLLLIYDNDSNRAINLALKLLRKGGDK